MKRGPQVYDLPVANLHPYVGHYTPPKARDETEIQRRSMNPAGSLVLEAQHDGVKVMERTFRELLGDEEAKSYFVRQMGGVCLNSAWYSYAHSIPGQSPHVNDNVTRRRLELPRHARVDDEGEVWYETVEGNDAWLEDDMTRAARLSKELELAHKRLTHDTAYQRRKQFGHTIGNIGLRLVASPLIGRRASAYEVQTDVRDAARYAIEQSREQYDGAYSTLAQLADRDSQLAVRLRREAPTTVRDAITDSMDIVENERNTENER